MAPSRLIRSSTVFELGFSGPGELGVVGIGDFAVRYRGFIDIPASGEYQFNIQSDDGVCLAIGREIVVDENRVKDYLPAESVVYLEAGLRPVELRFFHKTGQARLRVRWKPPAARLWAAIPMALLRTASVRTN